MLKIRLQRVGRTHEPAFRLVLTDSKNSTKSGKILEILDDFDARHGETATFKSDRVKYWIGKGAQITPTVHNLLISKKIIEGKKINVLPLKKFIIKESLVVAESSSEAKETVMETKTEEVAEIPTEEIVVETPAEIKAEVVA